MVVISDGGSEGVEDGRCSFVCSVSLSSPKSGSIRVEPMKTVLARMEKKRVIWPRWNRSH